MPSPQTFPPAPGRSDAPLPATPGRFLWNSLRRGFLGRTVLLNLTAAGGIALMGLEPVALRALVDGLATAPAGAGGWSAGVVGWFLALGGLWIGSALFNRLRELTELHTLPALSQTVQSRLFGHLLGHAPRYFQDSFAGDLGQKVKQAGQAATQLLAILSNDLIRILIVLAIGLSLLLTANPLFAILLLGWTAAHLLVSAVLARHCLRLSRALSQETSLSTGRMVDVIANVELVRAFATAPAELERLTGALDAERRRAMDLRRFLMLQGLGLFSALILFQLALLGLAVSQAAQGRMTAGDFAMVFSLSAIIGTNVWNLSSRLLDLFEQFGVLGNALGLIARAHDIPDPAAAPELRLGHGGITVRGLGFAHADGNQVFKGLDLTIAPGERVALVGPSGAGKSTLVRLLRRQYVPQAGSIHIDGQNIATVSLASLNRAIAEVPQAPTLFHRSIRDNIAYGLEAVDEAAVRAAAAKAHCDGFIRARPGGYGAVVGEQGLLLSGGERQRIAIARAFLKDAPILVLDEATSSLDSETERQIQDALWQLFEGRTVIAIAHRLSTIADMDRILVLENGRIVEEGRHANLLAMNGTYARLWACQVGGFLP